MTPLRTLLVFALLIPLFSRLLMAAEQAELVLLGGRVITMDQSCPAAEAIACSAGRLLAVGSREQVSQYIGANTKILDIRGKTAYPGFIEGHGHFLGLGESKMILDLSKVANWEELIEKVRQAAEGRPAGQWILGRGWRQAKWDPPVEPNVEGYPIHTALSRAVPNHLVLLTHGSGHMSLANAKAMELAGIGPETKAPSGGEILRDGEGQPTAVFRESAQGLVRRVADDAVTTEEQVDEAIGLASEECLRKGITSFCDAGSSFDQIDHYRQLAESGRLSVRLWVMIGSSNKQLADRLSDYRFVGVGDNFLTVRAIKRFMDGALEAHGAWLLEPYNDLSGRPSRRISRGVSHPASWPTSWCFPTTC